MTQDVIDTAKQATSKKKSLGRGLSVLFNEASNNEALNHEIEKQIPASDVVFVDIGKISPNADQPRKHVGYEALSELAQSIREKGVLQPILVRRKIDKETGTAYEIIAGERRWRAARLAQESKIPVLVKECNDQEVLEIALIENIQREELNPIEEGEAYKLLLNTYGYTQERLAEIVGKNRTTIAHSMRLLTLPEKLRDLLIDGQLSAGHGKLLVGVDNWEVMVKKVIRDQLNVRQTEKLIRTLDLTLSEDDDTPRKKKLVFSADEVEQTKAHIEEIQEAYKTYPKDFVKVKFDKEKGGHVQFNFNNYEELEMVLMNVVSKSL